MDEEETTLAAGENEYPARPGYEPIDDNSVNQILSNKTSASSNIGVLDIDWDINLVINRSGFDKSDPSKKFKTVANVTISCLQNTQDSNSTSGRLASKDIKFEIDKESGNCMLKKLQDLERIFKTEYRNFFNRIPYQIEEILAIFINIIFILSLVQ